MSRELIFGVNVTDLDLGVRINPVKQPINPEQLPHCGTSTLIIILITASLSSKTYNIAPGPECVVFDEMWWMFVGMTLVCLIGMWLCILRGFRHSASLHAEWFLMSQLVDRRSLEICGMYWVFSLCGWIGRWRRGSAHGGKRVREQPWMRHVTHQMTCFQTQRWPLQFLSQAHQLCGARLSTIEVFSSF